MKALVFEGIGEIAFKEVPDPKIQDPKDAIVKITTSAICGTDLHLVRGTIPGVKSGTILGHEAVGVVESIGKQVDSIKVGDRVIIPSTVGCGYCDYCSQELYAQCDNANPHGKDAGTVFYGGPASSGPLNGLQAEKVRVPFADSCLVKIPHTISDEQAILLSDILPTAYMAVELAQCTPKDTVAVFGCGPVGQLVIACLKQLKVKHIIAIDSVPDRLEMARKQGAETINFDEKDPIQELRKLTNNHGPNKIIDAVGIDAEQPKHSGFYGFFKNFKKRRMFKHELKEVAPKINPHDGNWYPGNGPSQVFQWAIEAIAKAGILSIIGVYTDKMRFFPIGAAMNKNLTIRMGNCNHKKYIPLLLGWVKKGVFDPLPFITKRVPLSEIIEAYKHFDKRDNQWIKVVVSCNN